MYEICWNAGKNSKEGNWAETTSLLRSHSVGKFRQTFCAASGDPFWPVIRDPADLGWNTKGKTDDWWGTNQWTIHQEPFQYAEFCLWESSAEIATSTLWHQLSTERHLQICFSCMVWALALSRERGSANQRNWILILNPASDFFGKARNFWSRQFCESWIYSWRNSWI